MTDTNDGPPAEPDYRKVDSITALQNGIGKDTNTGIMTTRYQ